MAVADWAGIEEGEVQELLESTVFESSRDLLLFCIDCSESMQALRPDPYRPGYQTSHFLDALDAAVQIQKRKVIVGPTDAVGVLFFNTTLKNPPKPTETDYKRGTYVYQPMTRISAPPIQKLLSLLDDVRENPNMLREAYPPVPVKIPMGDVFTSCNWALRDGAQKTGLKRIFLVTDEDNPHAGSDTSHLMTTAKTNLEDLMSSGATLEPFFIETKGKQFDLSPFHNHLLRGGDDKNRPGSGILPEDLSMSRITNLVAEMKFRVVPKRSLFSLRFELAAGFVIGVKGYGLVTEQKKSTHQWFMDMGDHMATVNPETHYVDEDEQREAPRSQIVYGMELGNTGGEDDDASFGTRTVPVRSKVFYTANEIRSFKSFGLDPGIKLLGFKDASELAIEDNVKHSWFIYPDEEELSGSKRTFAALLRTLKKKNKIGIVRCLVREGWGPFFAALLPQVETNSSTGYSEPSGFHLVPLPFADDLRPAPIEKAARASEETVEAASAWISKLLIKNEGYMPEGNPNPALAWHFAQLEASAFREEFDVTNFVDPTLPRLASLQKRTGSLIEAWNKTLEKDPSSNAVEISALAGTKRKADVSLNETDIRSRFEEGQTQKLRVDQLKEFCKSKGLQASGKKVDLLDRVGEWLKTHPA